MKLYVHYIICVSLFLTSISFASEHVVRKDVAGDFATIQSALNSSTAGDTIVVHPGTYHENISIDKNITLTSTDPNNPNDTIIDGQQLDYTVTFSGVEDANCTLTGFEITNGIIGIYGLETQATIRKCHISNNLAEGILNCDGLIDGCIVYGNQGTGLSFCDGRIESCYVKENQYSGIRYCDGVIKNSVITNNYTRHYSGGIGNSDGIIINCVISNNHADRNGGGVRQCNYIRNCVIFNNSANGTGGGISDCQGSVVNCTIVGNHASGRGGGVDRGDGVIKNSIIWYNTAGSYDDIFIELNDISYSCYPGATGEMNISHKPLFRNVFSANKEEWDLHLAAGSPCIDSGTNSVSVELYDVDIDGNDRLQDSDNDGTVTIDMGAYEYLPSSLPAISLSENLFEFITYEASLKTDIQNGSFVISNWGSQILHWNLSEDISWLSVNHTEGSSGNHEDATEVTFTVDNTGLAPGDHEGTITINSENCSNSPVLINVLLTVRHNLLVPNEFSSIQSAINFANDYDNITVSPGTYHENISIDKNIILSSLDPHDPNIVSNTILHGATTNYVILFEGTEDESCLITGFTITNGSRDGTYGEITGEGINGNHTKATISHCIIKHRNTNANSGKAIVAHDGLISDCTIEGRGTEGYSTYSGIDDCHGTIRRCIIRDNNRGIYDCSGLIKECIITNNHTWGIYRFTGKIINSRIENNGNGIAGGGTNDVHNCVIANNLYSGVVGDGKITNCTIVGNGASGVANNYTSIENCIIAFNQGYGLNNGADGLPSINYCLFYNNSSGLCVYNSNVLGEPDKFIYTVSQLNSDNISEDPLTLGWQGGNLNLWPGSPCIDNGNPSYTLTDNEKDLDGKPRVSDGNNDGISVIDIGAYEVGDSSTILCDTSEIVFNVNQISPSQMQTVNIGSFSSSPLLWESINNCSWLKVAPQEGELTNEINQIVIETKDLSAVSPGIYQESIYIKNKNVDTVPIEINISLDMREPIYVPDDHATIRQAVNASSDHDWIIVRPGTYTEDITITNKNIVIRSLDPKDDDVVASTIIQQKYNSSIVTFSSGAKNRTLEGFTIQGGECSNGAGIYFDNCTSMINDCVIQNNHTSSYGGGCYVVGSMINFNNCSFNRNSADNKGGAIYANNSSTISFSGCEFESNFTSESSTTGYGGGVYNLNSNMSFDNCSFTNNSTRFAGGAVCNYVAEAIFSQCTFIGNIGYDNPGDGGAGCAVYNWTSSPIFQDCTFSNNIAYGPYSSGAAVYNFYMSSPEFTDCKFIGNQCIGDHSQGGAVWNRQDSDPVFNRCDFINNFATNGGAVNSVGSVGLAPENWSTFSERFPVKSSEY